MNFGYIAVVAVLIGTMCSVCAAQGLRRPAWEAVAQEVVESKRISDLTSTSKWTSKGWPQSKASISSDDSLEIQARVDSKAAARAAFEVQLSPSRDWSAYDGIRFTVTAQEAMLNLRIIINEESQLKLAVPVIGSGDTRTVVLSFPEDKRDVLKEVSLVQFFLVAKEYTDGTQIRFKAQNFELVKLATLPKNEAGVELIIGDESKVAIIPFDAELPQWKAVIYTGSECNLQQSDILKCTATELFTDKVTCFDQPMGKSMKPGERLEVTIKPPSAPPGYYWVTCDLMRGDDSLVGARVGFADFYQQAKGESMTHTILSLRVGMGLYIIDPVGGYGRGSIVLMHTYDPRDASHYVDFIKAYQKWSPKSATTSKDTENMEAGVSGTVFAAAAFRAAGEVDRTRFADKILKNNCDYMVNYMQNPDGSTKWEVNEYYSRNLGDYRDVPTDVRVPDTNAVGEWLRSISRTILYFKDVPGEQAYVDKLYNAALKSADYLVSVSTEETGKWKHVIRHFKLVDGKYPGGRREIYHEGGKQCDVYLPRAMSGLSYFAYVRQLREGSVPQSYLDALKDTTEWALEKMKSDTGWFDWQCGYEAEGGCHAFLGNQYLAEASQGYYLLCAARGDVENAKLAAECTKRALHWVTDHDRYTSKFKGPFEFWVGPYLYWQFTEYLGSIGDDPAFSAFLVMLHKGWAQKREWQDFTQRTGESIVFRANELCNIHQSILAYPALRLMEEIGKPFRYDVKSLATLTRPAK